MVLLVSDFDQSKYLNATQFVTEKAVRIKSVTVEAVQKGIQQEKRLVVWFTNLEKGLLLNKTNLRTLGGAFGNDAETWVGKIIVIFPTTTEFGGRTVSALRVRIPPPKQATAGATAGNSQPAKPKAAAPKAAPPPEPEPSLADDLDDEITF